MSEATACSVCDEDPCVSGCTVRVPLIRLYMAIGTAQSGGHHADAAVMSRAIESHDGNSESVWIPGPVDEVVRRYGERAMTYDVTKNAEFATEEDDAMHLDWLDEARSGSDLHLLSGWVRARMEAYRAENADLIRRVREAEEKLEAARGGRETWFALATQAEAERDAVTAERDALASCVWEAERERAKAAENGHGYMARLSMCLGSTIPKLEAERDAAIAAMEARPAITREDAAKWLRVSEYQRPPYPHADFDGDCEGYQRALAALREHARKADR